MKEESLLFPQIKIPKRLDTMCFDLKRMNFGALELFFGKKRRKCAGNSDEKLAIFYKNTKIHPNSGRGVFYVMRDLM